MLSIGEPLGHQGPNAKSFCQRCYATRPESNPAGCPHLPRSLPGFHDPRDPDAMAPLMRQGTASYSRHRSDFLEARSQYEEQEAARGPPGRGLKRRRGGVSKPEEKQFGSVVNQPLFYVRHLEERLSCTPLHVVLGITLDMFHDLEARLRAYDIDIHWRSWAEGADDGLLARLASAEAELRLLHGREDTAAADLASHRNAIQVIESTPGAEAAVERGKKPKSRKRGYSSLPLEDEYRVHTKAAEAAKTLCEQIAAEIGKALKGISALRAENPGPFLKVAVAFHPLPHFLARSPHASSTPPDPLRRSPSTR